MQCFTCEDAITDLNFISCSGYCRHVFHTNCAKIDPYLILLINENPGLFWRCPFCRDISVSNKIYDLFSKNCSTLFDSLNTKFEKMKTDFMEIALKELNEFPLVVQNSPNKAPLSYAKTAALQQTTIVIKPKNPTQSSSKTKADILLNVDPEKSSLPVTKVKSLKDGGLLVGCSVNPASDNFKEIISTNLSQNYNVKEIKCVKPRLRIVGMSDRLDESTFSRFLIKQNSEIFEKSYDVNILSILPTKKNTNIYQALIQVDNLSYTNLLTRGCVIIGYDDCFVYDAFPITRCFTCNAFNHTSKGCQLLNKLVCPLCSENHSVKDCKAESKNYICSNCMSFKKTDSNIDVNHAVWNYNKCSSYKKAIIRIKTKLGMSTLQ